jgi:hypothetical protein
LWLDLQRLRVVLDLKRSNLVGCHDLEQLREDRLTRAVLIEAYASCQWVEAVFEDRQPNSG